MNRQSPSARFDKIEQLANSALDAVGGCSIRHASVMDMGVARAPTIWRSYPCR
jgi:hypothetical protein